MHRIQRHIIQTLMSGPPMRYGRIKPKDIEGNLFMYHLRQLIGGGLVKKKGNEYTLTAEGMRFVQGLSLKTFTERIQPKIVTLIGCHDGSGQWLLYRRKRQPFIGKVGFPYGKIHLGETIQKAAARECLEKTGLSVKPVHSGDVYVTVYRDNELISHMLFHVFAGSNPRGNLVEQSEIGQCFWAEINRTEPESYFPGFLDIYGMLQRKRKDRFFAEFVYHLS